jgi:hypothetical protein
MAPGCAKIEAKWVPGFGQYPGIINKYLINEWGFLYSTIFPPKQTLKALGYTSKCIEAVPDRNWTWIAGVPTRRSDH